MKKTKIKINQRRFFLNILLPTFLTFGLFITLIFTFIIPSFEESLLAAKKEMTKELVNACTGIAARYEAEVREGKLEKEEAMELAKTGIEHLRYGINNKDYFWITDMQPRMVMHPYRDDLDGQDLNDFRDPEGKALFVEMVDVVKKDGSGYVYYMWQWMDDSSRIVPKISYVAEFKPWGWVIGTGVYIEDIRTEIAAVIRRLLMISLGISLIMALLLFMIVRNNLKAERKRSRAEDELKDSRERYKALVEASDEGTLMILNGKCVYANEHAKNIFAIDEFGTIPEDLRGLIHPSCSGDMQRIRTLHLSGENSMQLETLLSGAGGKAIPALLSVSGIDINGERGLIMIIKDLRRDKGPGDLGSQHSNPVWLLAENLGYGAFRAHAGRKGRFIKANQHAARILGFPDKEEMLQYNILDLVEDQEERMNFLRVLSKNGSVRDFRMHIRRADGTYAEILVTATLIHDESSGMTYSEGFFEDRTEQLIRENQQNKVVNDVLALARLDAAPVQSIMKPVLSSPETTRLADGISLMNTYGRSCLLVRGDGETFIGMLTDEMIRRYYLQWVSQEKLTLGSCVQTPLPHVLPQTPIHDAWAVLRKAGSGAVVLKQADGKVIGVAEADDFISMGMNPVNTLYSSIQGADTLNGLISAGQMLPHYVRVLIQSGARISAITQLTTTVSDEISFRLIEIVQNELGPPPAKFAWVCMGSQGRGEQTLVTDQDNAIIYEDVADEKEAEVNQYFLSFGQKMNQLLAQTGYELCKGGIMAGNPRWTQSLSKWQRYFREWITTPEPQNLLESSIFFDFRCVSGDSTLTERLRADIFQTMTVNPAFYGHMAKVCTNYKIPLGMFGKIQTESKENQENSINIKNAIRVIVSMVRLYAMQQKSEYIGTGDRLLDLFAKNVISSALYADLAYSYEYFSMLQFRNQVRQFTEMKTMDHYLDLAVLPGIETEMLKAAFAKLGTFQSKMKFDFGIGSN